MNAGDWIALGAAVATAGGVAASAWTIRLTGQEIRRDIGGPPRLNITISIKVIEVDADVALIQVPIEIENVGRLPFVPPLAPPELLLFTYEAGMLDTPWQDVRWGPPMHNGSCLPLNGPLAPGEHTSDVVVVPIDATIPMFGIMAVVRLFGEPMPNGAAVLWASRAFLGRVVLGPGVVGTAVPAGT